MIIQTLVEKIPTRDALGRIESVRETHDEVRLSDEEEAVWDEIEPRFERDLEDLPRRLPAHFELVLRRLRTLGRLTGVASTRRTVGDDGWVGLSVRHVRFSGRGR